MNLFCITEYFIFNYIKDLKIKKINQPSRFHLKSINFKINFAFLAIGYLILNKKRH